MRAATKATFASLSIVVFLIIAACNSHKSSIPFPEPMERPQPVTTALEFTEATPLTWPRPKPVKPVVEKFDFNKLPAQPLDDGWTLFSKPPEERPFDLDKLPDTAFNYDALPSKPLKFEISVLQPAELIKTPLHPKTNARDVIYELGGPLTNKMIITSFEDRNRFLWISTEQGVYRYDGENLVLYLRLAMTESSGQILEDNKGQIWITTGRNNDGIYIINQKAGVAKHLTVSGGLFSNINLRMTTDPKGRIWISSGSDQDSSETGINIIDENSNTIRRFGQAQGLSVSNTLRVYSDNENKIWITSATAGINIIDLEKGKLKFLNEKTGFTNDTTGRFLQDANGRIWMAASFGAQLYAIDSKLKRITRYSQQQGLAGNLNSLANDNEGNIWVGTRAATSGQRAGITILDPERKEFKILNTNSGLNSDETDAILKDRRGQMWIATSKGLNMLNRNGTAITHTGSESVNALAGDREGRIWVATFHGVKIIDHARDLTRSLTVGDGLSNDTVQNIRMINGNMCIMTNRGLDVIDSNFATVTHLGKQSGLTFEPLTFFKDGDGLFWIAGVNVTHGIDVYNSQQQNVRHLGAEQGIKDSLVSEIVQAKGGYIWFTSSAGTAGVIDPAYKTVKYVENVRAVGEKPMLVDTKGNVWIGTSEGIYVVNRQADSITSIRTGEGLVDKNIKSLIQYKDRVYVSTSGGLTVITSPFLSPENKWAFESFGPEEGVMKVNNAWASDMITSDGTFLWGDAGVTAIHVNNHFIDSPETEITGIDAFNRPLYFSDDPWKFLNENDTLRENDRDKFYMKGQLPANLLFLSQSKITYDSVSGFNNMPLNLSLPYYQNYLQFHFTQLHVNGNGTTSYRYILEGADTGWSERIPVAESDNYLDLSPGKYTFRVASLLNGKWTRPAAFSFVIMPPWWKTWWAYGLFVLAISTVLFVAVQYRSRHLKAANLALEEKIKERTAQLEESLQELKAAQGQLIHSEKMASLGDLTAGIAHEIQNPLNFVNNFSEVNGELISELVDEADKGNLDEVKLIAVSLKDNGEKIIQHGKRADAIVKGMLLHSKTSTGAKEPKDINKLTDEYLHLAYHGMRAKEKSFNATLRTNFDPDLSDVDGKVNIVPQDIGRVLLNLFNNAFYALIEKNKNPAGFEEQKRHDPSDAAGSQPDADAGQYAPKVTVVTRKLNAKIEIRVKDNGPGIPQNIVDKIFQPFFTTKPTGEGTGLGLSLAYDIIKAHGGEIKVKTKEGEGSEFTIQLPIT